MNLNNDPDTSKIMDHLLPDIDNYPFIFDHENKKIKNMIKKFYTELDNIYKKKLKVLNYTKTIKVKNKNTINDLLDSAYTPTSIKKKMEDISSIIEYSTVIHSVPIKIIFLSPPGLPETNYNFYFKEISHWLTFIMPYSNSKMKSFKVVLYLSDFKKKLPEKQTDILDTTHVNTAVTYACAINGTCLIYRKEEWFKVLIHETMHAFCLDFSGLNYDTLRNKFKDIFPLDIDFEISESYSEFWATILNALFKTYEQKVLDNDIKGFDTFYNIFSSMIYLEISFSLFQAVKILQFMDIDYVDLYKNNIIYKQKTNVFEYYVLKSILLFNYIDFLKLCDTNNTNCINFYKSNNALNDIFEFVEKKYDDKGFIKGLRYMKNLLNRTDDNFMKTTMRMTIF